MKEETLEVVKALEANIDEVARQQAMNGVAIQKRATFWQVVWITLGVIAVIVALSGCVYDFYNTVYDSGYHAGYEQGFHDVVKRLIPAPDQKEWEKQNGDFGKRLLRGAPLSERSDVPLQDASPVFVF